MDRYLGGEDIDLEVLIDDLETAVARGDLLPGLAGLRRRPGSACTELLELDHRGVPVAAGAPGARR